MAKTPINWKSEEETMKLLGYKKASLRILTRNAKRKTLPIRTAKLNARTILYAGVDIDNYILSKQTA